MDSSDTPSFAQKLRDLRTAAGLSQEALADRSGLSLRGISDLERGLRKTPRLETVRLIAAGLGLDESQRDTLLALARPPEPNGRSGARRAGVLPQPLTTLIGRDKEIATVTDLLRREEARLITLTGPGGVGKTSLAIAVANAMADRFADGATYVPLGSLIDPRLVILALAKALGLSEAGHHTMSDTVRQALRVQRRLVVFDNFEHLMGAATLVAELLASCQGVKVLVTSRERLNLGGERVVSVNPLLSLDPGALSGETLGNTPAVQLFLLRVREIVPDFDLTDDDMSTVAAICHRLDGLPLALELAASWIPVLAPDELLARLDHRLPVLTRGRRDAQESHQTLRDAIAWSYKLLAPAERRVFRWLSVFVGGADLDAIEAVMENEETRASGLTIDIVASLIDKSLIRTDNASSSRRFTMLETIREFALAELEHEGEHEAARRRHAAWYVDVGMRMEQHLLREVDSRWLDRLEVEHGNLRNALVWTLFTSSDADSLRLGLRLARSIWLFWYYHSHLAEGRWWLEHAIAAAGDIRDADHAMALVGLGTLANAQGDHKDSLTWLDQGLEMAREANDPTVTAFALSVRGNWSEHSGHYDDAERFFAEANRIFAQIDDRVNVAITGYHLGVVAFGQGRLDEAERRYLDALALSRHEGDSWGKAVSLAALGLVHTRQGKMAVAADDLDQALAIFMGIGSTERIADTLCRIAVLGTENGLEHTAAWLFMDASRMRGEVGTVQALPEREVYEAAQRRSMATASGEDDDWPRRSMDETVEDAHRLLMHIADLTAHRC